MRHRHHQPAFLHLTDMSDQMLLLLLLAHHGEELGIMNDIQACIDHPPPMAFDMDCQAVRQAIADGADEAQYRKALDLFTCTGSAELFRNLRGIRVTERSKS